MKIKENCKCGASISVKLEPDDYYVHDLLNNWRVGHRCDPPPTKIEWVDPSPSIKTWPTPPYPYITC